MPGVQHPQEQRDGNRADQRRTAERHDGTDARRQSLPDGPQHQIPSRRSFHAHNHLSHPHLRPAFVSRRAFFSPPPSLFVRNLPKHSNPHFSLTHADILRHEPPPSHSLLLHHDRFIHQHDHRLVATAASALRPAALDVRRDGRAADSAHIRAMVGVGSASGARGARIGALRLKGGRVWEARGEGNVGELFQRRRLSEVFFAFNLTTYISSSVLLLGEDFDSSSRSEILPKQKYKKILLFRCMIPPPPQKSSDVAFRACFKGTDPSIPFLFHVHSFYYLLHPLLYAVHRQPTSHPDKRPNRTYKHLAHKSDEPKTHT